MYYRQLRRGVWDRNYQLIPSDHNVFDYIDDSSDWYVSIYEYNDQHYDKFQETRSIAGIRDVTTTQLIWDFDNAKNIEEARQDAVTLCNRLIAHGISEKDLHIAFSGKKGFCVGIRTDKRITVEQFKNATFNLAGDLSTFDKTINDSARILRIPGTKHPDTGLYKFPLTFKQITELKVDQIQKLASDIDNRDKDISISVVSVPNSFFESEKKTVTKNNNVVTMAFNFNKKVKGWTNCKWALTQGYEVKEHNRNEKLLCVIATCKALNYTPEQAYYMAKNAMKMGVDRYGGKEGDKKSIWEKVETVYSNKWTGGTYSCKDGKSQWLTEICQSLGKDGCTYHQKEEKLVLEASDLIDYLDDYIVKFDENRIKTGIAAIDDQVNLTIGMPVGILAPPSVGKTSLLLRILENNSLQDVHSMFFSLDMFNAHIGQKFLQNITSWNFDKIRELRKQEPQKLITYYNELKQKIKCIHTVSKSGISVDDMREIILEYERESGNKITIVAIDYLELIAGPYSDETANSGYNAKKLKDLSTDLGVCILVLLQPQKTAEPDQPITSYRSIKGASLLEQCFRVVLSLHRPGFSCNTVDQDKFLGINCVKNSLGPLFSEYMYWDGLTGEVRDLNDEEESDLKELLARKAAEKEQSSEW